MSGNWGNGRLSLSPRPIPFLSSLAWSPTFTGRLRPFGNRHQPQQSVLLSLARGQEAKAYACLRHILPACLIFVDSDRSIQRKRCPHVSAFRTICVVSLFPFSYWAAVSGGRQFLQTWMVREMARARERWVCSYEGRASYVLPQVPPVNGYPVGTFHRGTLARLGGASSAVAVHALEYYSAASDFSILSSMLCSQATSTCQYPEYNHLPRIDPSSPISRRLFLSSVCSNLLLRACDTLVCLGR
ncbi:hypothetical protein ACQKWADRAFT_106948 [Trichoderma austrokoningii]